ncbi:MAG: peptidylprolyl isomerase [Desulfobacteraceae bacterium 4572_35.1]|nr:MAG: peptidylprolyl isomerase [Desulfobacteraceae bacterium 4572_35.1]
MFIAKKGDTVKVHYTGRLADGTVFDTSDEKKPLLFMLGKKEVVAGFDEAVTGMVPGEKKTVTISPEKGYGESKPELIETIKRTELPSDVEFVVGGQIEITNDDGSLFYVMVVDQNDTEVTLDGNHPLAGKDLIFDIRVEEVIPEKKCEDNPLEEILGKLN